MDILLIASVGALCFVVGYALGYDAANGDWLLSLWLKETKKYQDLYK